MVGIAEPVIVEVFRYHVWANRELFRFCQTLSAGQLASSALGTFGSIYDTLRHVAVSEQWYVADLGDRPRENSIARGERPDVATLARHIEKTGEGLIETAAELSMLDLAHWSDRGRDESMLAIRLAIQVLDHAMEHRTQIRTVLSQIGVTPPEIDGWAYDAVQPNRGDYLTDGARKG